MKLSLTIILGLLSSTVFAQIQRPTDDLLSMASRLNAGKTPQEIRRESESNYARFITLDVNASAPNNIARNDDTRPKLRTLTWAQAESVLNIATHHEVVSLTNISKYEKKSKGIGYCFGRAMFIDTFLTLAGLHRANIKKAFVIGSMGGGDWGWHVTTIVQSKHSNGKERWLAIDPVAGRVMDVRDWYKHWQYSSDDGKLRLFIAERTKFGAGPSWYSENQISDPFYSGYFRDMMRWFARNGAVEIDRL
jgi:hypothetical protein